MTFLRLTFFCLAATGAAAVSFAAAGSPPVVPEQKTPAQIAESLKEEMQTVQRAREAMKLGVRTIEPPPTLSMRAVPLRDAVDLALRQNFGLQISRYRPSIAADEVEIARAAFDVTLSAGAAISERVSAQASSVLDGALQPENKGQEYGLTLSQKLVTGATVQVGTGMSRSENNSTNSTINPYYSSQTGFRITQPLLAGGGTDINLAPVAIALSSHRQSKYELRKSILDLIADTEVAYWNLAANYELKVLRETSVQLAHAMLEENRERARIGLATHAEVLEAEAYLASRLENIILAQQAIDNAEDRLRVLLGSLAFESPDVIHPQPLSQDDPGLPKFEDIVRSSMAQDYDYFVQQEEIEKQRIRVNVARNANQPTLNVSAGAYGLGMDGGAWTSYRNSYEADGNSWNAGLVLSMPIGFRSEQADERRAYKNLDIASLKLAELQQTLMANVRKAWRDVAAGRQRRATTLASLELNLESYQRQQAQYRAGMISLRDLLQAQSDLDAARINNLQAAYDLTVADVQLKRLTGEILARNGFRWVDAQSAGSRLSSEKTLAGAHKPETDKTAQ